MAPTVAMSGGAQNPTQVLEWIRTHALRPGGLAHFGYAAIYATLCSFIKAYQGLGSGRWHLTY